MKTISDFFVSRNIKLTALFPASITVISFVLFIIVYLLVTMTVAEPYYLTGLLFAVPFCCFAIITGLTAVGKLKGFASKAITYHLIFALGLVSLFLFVSLSIDAATTTTTDLTKYERVLKLSGYPNDRLTKYFPDKIPDDAENVHFSYNPAFMQGGEEFSLKFKTSTKTTQTYIKRISNKASWVGKPNAPDSEKYGIFTGSLNAFYRDHTEMPADLTIYVMYSKPYHPDDWNHGENSLVAISQEKNEILFRAEDW